MKKIKQFNSRMHIILFIYVCMNTLVSQTFSELQMPCFKIYYPLFTIPDIRFNAMKAII